MLGEKKPSTSTAARKFSLDQDERPLAVAAVAGSNLTAHSALRSVVQRYQMLRFGEEQPAQTIVTCDGDDAAPAACASGASVAQ
jgi:hypothetical protein